MDPSISATSLEVELSDVYDSDEEIGLEHIKERVLEDIQDAKKHTVKQIHETKAAVANLVPFLKKKQGDARIREVEPRRSPGTIRSQTGRWMETSLSHLTEKVTRDLQVVHLFDRESTHEIKHLVGRNVVDHSINIVKNKTQEEFLKIKEDANVSVAEAKSTLRNYLNNLSSNRLANQKEIDDPDEKDVFNKINERTQEDFENINQKNQTDVDNAKCKVKEKINKFLTYQTGKETDEELKVEETIMAKVIEFEKIMKEDLKKEKDMTEQAIEETRSKVATKIKSIGADGGLKDLEDKLLKLHDKTRSDFNEINTKLHDEVANIKDKIKLPNVPESDEADKSINAMLDYLKKTLQADFNETNSKINADVRDISLKVVQNIGKKIVQNIALTEIPQSSRNLEVSHIVGIGLNQFHNTFEQRDKQMRDNVQGAKSKIDDSVNALKNKLFKK